MVIIPTGPSLIIHGLVIVVSKFFPDFFIRYKKMSTGVFGFMFVVLYLVCVALFVVIMFYHLFTSQNNINYIYKMVIAMQRAIDQPVIPEVLVLPPDAISPGVNPIPTANVIKNPL